MRVAILILVIISQHCYAQADYNAKLSARLEEIKELQEFDNSVVVYDDSSGYGSTYPRWTPAEEFLMDDIVTFKGDRVYLALMDNRGKNPAYSPNEWRLLHEHGPRPYLFLRDTAKTEDLISLLTSDHPFIRTYVFGALAYRKHDNLFQVVVDNLKDTTRFVQFTSDFGEEVSPADLMLWYMIDRFDVKQKDILKKLILIKYTHLNTLEEILLFHKPIPDEYQPIKEIATKSVNNTAALVALSRYRKVEDIELIRTGFKDIEQYNYSGYQIFFLAIENFPDKSFKKDLIDYKSKIKMTDYIGGDDCYFKSLAAYHDKECLKVLEEFVDQKSDDGHRATENRDENLRLIYQALKKHYTPMYDDLMKKIEKTIIKKSDLEFIDYRLEDSPWNY